LTSPLFCRGKILVHLNTIIDCTDRLLDRWRTYYNDPTKNHLNMIEQSQQLLMTVFGFLAAVYETTSSIRSWFIYFMSKNSEIQKKIKDEHNVWVKI